MYEVCLQSRCSRDMSQNSEVWLMGQTGKSWGREVTTQREVDYPPCFSFNFFTESTSKKTT